MLKRGRKINRAPVRIRHDLYQNDKQSNGINALGVKSQLHIETADNFSSDDITVTDILTRPSSNSTFGQSSGEEPPTFKSEKIDTGNTQDAKSSLHSDDSTEDCKFSVNADATHGQLKFENEDIGIEIVELDSVPITRDQVHELLGNFCDDEEDYADSNSTLKDIDEQIENEISCDVGNTEGVTCDDSDQLFICDICQKSFQTNSKLQKHLSRVHTREKIFECRQCLKRFSYEGYMYKHKCGAQSVNMEIQESYRSQYECRVCAQTFESKYYLKKHVQSEGHESIIEKPYTCSECLRSYTRQSHLRSHKCRLHMCETCGTSFSDLTRLEKHAEQHSGKRMYVCAKCKKVYMSLPGLRYHEMNHRGERRHVCATCGKCFAFFSTLRIHETCHSEQRPFPCLHPTCGKSFSILDHLRKHELRHTGLRPHGCPHCSKHFVDIANLKKHLKVHVEERPLYVCCLCDKQYMSLRGLRDHQVQHSGENQA